MPVVPPEGNARCHCGSEWWRPVPNMQENGAIGPAFALSLDGHISGYVATFLCGECGDEWSGPYMGLRLVE